MRRALGSTCGSESRAKHILKRVWTSLIFRGAMRLNESRPVQIIHWCPRASISAIAAVVSVVKNWTAVRHHAQDHLSELVECLVVQRLGWSTTNRHTITIQCFHHLCECRWTGFRQVTLTNREACSHEKESLEGIHPVSQRASHRAAVTLTSAPLYIWSVGPWDLARSAVHTKQGHTPCSAATLSVNLFWILVEHVWCSVQTTFFIQKKLGLNSTDTHKCPNTNPVQHLWEEADADIQHQWLTSLMLLWLSGRKSLQPGSTSLWKVHPEEWQLSQQRTNAHSFLNEMIACSHNFFVFLNILLKLPVNFSKIWLSATLCILMQIWIKMQCKCFPMRLFL